MRNATRRGELGQRVMRVGRPIAAGLGDFNESCAKGERRVAGEVADDQHLVAQGRNEEQVDGGEDARHFLGDSTAETVGLHEVDCGEEAGLAEGVGLGIGGLGFEFVDAMGEGELFKCGGGLGEENQRQRIVGPVG